MNRPSIIRLALLLLAATLVAPGAPVLAEDAAPALTAKELAKAYKLPNRVIGLSGQGVDHGEIVDLIEMATSKGLNAADLDLALEVENKQISAAGTSVSDFGSFLKSQLDAGLSGKDLTKALTAKRKALDSLAKSKKPAPAPK